MSALAAVLSVALAASAPGVRATLPPMPRELYRVAWERTIVGPRTLEFQPQEPGGVAVDPVSTVAVFGTRDGWLHAIRPDRSVAWEIETKGGFSAPPAIDGDTVYAGCDDGFLYAVALSTGAVRWKYDAKEELGTTPVVSGGMVYVASLQDTVFAIDAKTGAWKWHHRREPHSGFTVRGAAPVAVADGRVYAGYSDGFVSALDAATGQPKWERLVAPRGDQVDIDGLALQGRQLFVAAYSGAVLALDAETGETRWTHELKFAHRVTIAPGGMLVAVTPNAVHALSAADGTPLWTAPAAGDPLNAPVVAGKWLLVPAGEGGLRWLEAASGRVLRVFDPGSGVTGVPGVSAGRVYVLTNAGILFALDLT
jgi:outer membrane protein assembly factor BamB